MGRARRLRHLLQPGRARDERGPVLQPAVLQSEHLLPAPRSAAAHAPEPVSADFPVSIPQSATAYQPDLQTPGSITGTSACSINRPGPRTIEVAYVGSRGHDLISARDMNQPAPSPQVPNLRPEPALCRHHADRIARRDRRYNALQVQFQQQMADALSALVSYTFGKSMDDASGFFTSAGDPNFPQDSQNPEAEEGRSNFDVRHRLARQPLVRRAVHRPIKWVERLAAARPSSTHRERPAVHRRGASRHRRQQHRPLESRLRLQRPAERDRRSVAVGIRSVRDALVRHRRVLDAGLRHVRQLGPEHARRARAIRT